MEGIGRVREIKGDRAMVEIKSEGFCDGCQAKGGCNIFATPRVKIVEAKNIVGAKERDWVRLSLEEKKEFISSLLTFGLPILFLITGIALFGITGGILGVVLAFFLLWMVNNLLRKKGKVLPKIISIIKTEEEK